MKLFSTAKNFVPNCYIAAAWVTAMLMMATFTAPAYASPGGYPSNSCQNCHGGITTNLACQSLERQRHHPIASILKNLFERR